MTIEPPKLPPNPANDVPSTIKPLVVTDAPPMATSTAPDLEARIDLRKQELLAQLGELKASTQLDSVEAGDKIKARLSELDHLVKIGVVDGWANIGTTAKRRFDSWLAK
jgi:hypothetical protein